MCRHVLCRYTNTGRYRYRGAAETFEGEWRGESRTSDFTRVRRRVPCTYSDETRVLGGHGLLIVAVKLNEATLCDYVHVRVAGTNPTQSDVFRYLDAELADWIPTLSAWFARSFSTSPGSRSSRTSLSDPPR